VARRHDTPSCAYCGAPDANTVDHVVPLSLARVCRVPRRVLDNPSNRVPCCAACNSAKSNMHPREWLEAHPDYRKRLKRTARYLSDTVRRLAGLDEP
jgi:5-methylcytosine-specific restriction endonuclease McrA